MIYLGALLASMNFSLNIFNFSVEFYLKNIRKHFEILNRDFHIPPLRFMKISV